ncbi:MAG: PIG-L family deacetylase [Candidatus Paracaedibacteraceae bacterium]|nr:PIG-L family deacetylase [Candidatus Paracaedibacteraceae bacterium]
MLKQRKILIIAAHPDDETLGCGGTILKHQQNGDNIYLIWMTNGINARVSVSAEEKLARTQGYQAALKFIKPESYKLFDFPDNQMDTVPLLSVTQSLESEIIQIAPDIIYTHCPQDLNVDHVMTYKALITATRPGSKSFVKEIYGFEVPSSTEWNFGAPSFEPDTFVDITDWIDQKKELLKCYKDELRSFPHARSMENIIALNQVRGATANLPYAEAFITLRRVINA